tara:strand:+ start:478 stop:681 length:204 start_codon:yes stop_codon:yes gene_type:complete
MPRSRKCKHEIRNPPTAGLQPLGRALQWSDAKLRIRNPKRDLDDFPRPTVGIFGNHGAAMFGHIIGF